MCLLTSRPACMDSSSNREEDYFEGGFGRHPREISASRITEVFLHHEELP
jgi:hypothetical protein